MNAKKYNNAMKTYTGWHGPATVKAVMESIPHELQASVTGRELGMVMNAVVESWHRSRRELEASGGLACERCGALYHDA